MQGEILPLHWLIHPQFKAFEQAYDALTHDTAAQQTIAAYQAKVESLRALLMLNAVSESERAELEQLQQGLSFMRFCADLYCG